jgi:hypothetical protein
MKAQTGKRANQYKNLGGICSFQKVSTETCCGACPPMTEKYEEIYRPPGWIPDPWSSSPQGHGPWINDNPSCAVSGRGCGPDGQFRPPP